MPSRLPDEYARGARHTRLGLLLWRVDSDLRLDLLTLTFDDLALEGRELENSLQKHSPLDWSGYFDKEEDITIKGSNNVFHIYEAGSEGPVVFCLHGGGYSGLSFALSASKIKEKARVVAMDQRGHGKSSTDNDLDVSIETLCNDVVSVLKSIYGDSPPAIILVGHSMGGSVAVHVAARKVIPNLHGLVVVDVVEGTAMTSLIHMQKILSNRTQFFPTLEKAIEWSVKSGSLRNVESACISVPSTLKFDESKKCYTYKIALEETESYWKGWSCMGNLEKIYPSPVPTPTLLTSTKRRDRSLRFKQMTSNEDNVVVNHTVLGIEGCYFIEFASLIVPFIVSNRIGAAGIVVSGGRRGWL
ncbi:hypothetical protein KSP39_PZI020110 [Platanthera zijinensis]|uniref:protein phosphatase methylesterase-1 n=1 Tax=Platanthera zijinensis TaxID=2320716 RepID=A0AAP0FX93_9ASPA